MPPLILLMNRVFQEDLGMKRVLRSPWKMHNTFCTPVISLLRHSGGRVEWTSATHSFSFNICEHKLTVKSPGNLLSSSGWQMNKCAVLYLLLLYSFLHITNGSFVWGNSKKTRLTNAEHYTKRLRCFRPFWGKIWTNKSRKYPYLTQADLPLGCIAIKYIYTLPPHVRMNFSCFGKHNIWYFRIHKCFRCLDLAFLNQSHSQKETCAFITENVKPLWDYLTEFLLKQSMDHKVKKIRIRFTFEHNGTWP